MAAVWVPAGALVKDEFSQQSSSLEHALAVRAMYGRCHAHGLKCEDYAVPQTNWASLPIVVTCGDPLQFPPVPASSSLLADLENTSREHRVAEQMFADQDYACKLSTAMRFEKDPTLQRILEKMRTPGEDRGHLLLTAHEWKVLQSTGIEHGASLEGTEMWHQAGYPWTIVCMAMGAKPAVRGTSQSHLVLLSREELHPECRATGLAARAQRTHQVPEHEQNGTTAWYCLAASSHAGAHHGDALSEIGARRHHRDHREH